MHIYEYKLCIYIYIYIYIYCLRQIRVADTLLKWGKLWHAPSHNEWKTASIIYQYSKLHIFNRQESFDYQLMTV